MRCNRARRSGSFQPGRSMSESLSPGRLSSVRTRSKSSAVGALVTATDGLGCASECQTAQHAHSRIRIGDFIVFILNLPLGFRDTFPNVQLADDMPEMVSNLPESCI